MFNDYCIIICESISPLILLMECFFCFESAVLLLLFKVNISDAIMEVLIIFQLLLLLGASPTECQQCTNQDWTSTFAVAGDSMSQCNTNRSYVNALISQGYGVNLQTGPSIIEMARCCGVNLPYSQESNDCYWAQWWVWR